MRPLNPDFVLNQPRYQGASILLARENFGCGSSREHAPWALEEYGFRAIIAPSFADIFFNNCFKNGILPILLDANSVDDLFAEALASPGYRLIVDLERQEVLRPGGEALRFAVDAFRRDCSASAVPQETRILGSPCRAAWAPTSASICGAKS